MNTKKLLGQSLLSVAMLALVAGPAFASTSKISYNGYRSVNRIERTTKVTSSLFQTNLVNNVTKADVDQNTGDNDMDKNTNTGDMTQKTGDNSVHAVVTVLSGENVAEGDDCGCPQEEGDAKITNNGAKSKNTIKSYNVRSSVVKQMNVTNNTTMLKVNQNTGGNSMDKNVGGSEGGDMKTTTGDNTVVLDVLYTSASNQSM